MGKVTIKVSYKDDVRRISFPQLPKFQELQREIASLFSLNGFLLKYFDEDKDLITISSDSDLHEAASVLITDQSRGLLRLFIQGQGETAQNIHESLVFSNTGSIYISGRSEGLEFPSGLGTSQFNPPQAFGGNKPQFANPSANAFSNVPPASHIPFQSNPNLPQTMQNPYAPQGRHQGIPPSGFASQPQGGQQQPAPSSSGEFSGPPPHSGLYEPYFGGNLPPQSQFSSGAPSYASGGSASSGNKPLYQFGADSNAPSSPVSGHQNPPPSSGSGAGSSPFSSGKSNSPWRDSQNAADSSPQVSGGPPQSSNVPSYSQGQSSFPDQSAPQSSPVHSQQVPSSPFNAPPSSSVPFQSQPQNKPISQPSSPAPSVVSQPPPQKPVDQFDSSNSDLQTLLATGFPENLCRAALIQANGDVDEAQMLLLEGAVTIPSSPSVEEKSPAQSQKPSQSQQQSPLFVGKPQQPQQQPQPPKEEYNCQFISDVDTGAADLTNMAPGAHFKKTWRMKNIGRNDWDAGTQLIWNSGDRLEFAQKDKPVYVKARAGEVVDITVELVAPQAPGRYVSYFRLVLSNGTRFGHRIWTDVVVSEEKPQAQVEQAKPVPVQAEQPKQPDTGAQGKPSVDEEEILQQLEVMGFAREVAYPYLMEHGTLDATLNVLLNN